MSADVYPARSPDASYEFFEGEGEVLVLHLETGRYYTLNETAAAFWVRCDGTRSLREIAQDLQDEYVVDGPTLGETLNELRRDLVEEGLLIEHAASGQA
jgi:hypothetical protein